jgi:pimeloyl-ACP methyl ester carboxylesterase
MSPSDIRLEMSAAATRVAPDELMKLAARFDPTVMDVPGGKARIRLDLTGGKAWDALIDNSRLSLGAAEEAIEPDSLLSADAATWRRMATDLREGMRAFGARRLRIRRNLHLGVGFLAATSGSTEPGRLSFVRLRSPTAGSLSAVCAGRGDTVLCLHGLGGTKASFLPTVAALADSYRVVAIDLPGFGESDKPIGAPYNAPWFARVAVEALDALGVERAHLVGNSMGGRVAIEAGLAHAERVNGLALLSPALAWLRDRRWLPLVRLARPELGLLQVAPRPVVERVVRRVLPSNMNDWVAVGLDEFLRSYLTPRGRAAFYAAARSIYLDEPHGDDGFWTRLAQLAPDSLFVWGRKDTLVPIAFMRHVERVLPAARHLELDCGHVPQLERPRATHAAIKDFLRDS